MARFNQEATTVDESFCHASVVRPNYDPTAGHRLEARVRERILQRRKAASACVAVECRQAFLGAVPELHDPGRKRSAGRPARGDLLLELVRASAGEEQTPTPRATRSQHL